MNAPKASRASAPERKAPAPAAPITAASRAGVHFFGGVDATGEPDPMQARMDAAVAEHNARQLAALQKALDGKRPGHSLKGGA